MGRAVSSVSALLAVLSSIQQQFGATSLDQLDAAARLAESMRSLGATIGVDLTQQQGLLGWAPAVLGALNASPVCDADVACKNSRTHLQRLVTARDNGSLQSFDQLVQRLQSTQGTQRLDSTIDGLRAALNPAADALQNIGLSNSGGAQQWLSNMLHNTNSLAEAGQRVADGVQTLVDETKQMGNGLSDAAGFLLTMKDDTARPSMAGFYIPSQAFGQENFRSAASIFVSPDGHAVRYVVLSKLNPFSTSAMEQISTIIDTARGAQPNTSLSDASVSMVGVTAMYHDMRTYYERDIRVIIVVTLMVVLLILVLLLRAIVAPLYLIATVVISYLAALGCGVIWFQLIGGEPLRWTVPGMAFIVLVAVGADYNMLLITSIRDEGRNGIRSGVIRAVGSTGGVITSAGMIFAASMFGLLFGSITTMVQVGFVIGVGLLVDTFLVRTVTVPALAVLVGRANWWPAKRAANPTRASAADNCACEGDPGGRQISLDAADVRAARAESDESYTPSEDAAEARGGLQGADEAVTAEGQDPEADPDPTAVFAHALPDQPRTANLDHRGEGVDPLAGAPLRTPIDSSALAAGEARYDDES